MAIQYNTVQTKSIMHHYKLHQMEMNDVTKFIFASSIFFDIFFVKGTFIWPSWPSKKPFKHFDTISTYTFHIYWKTSWNKKYCTFLQKNQTRAKIFVKLICFLFLGAEIQRKESLCPPPKRGCTWDEYIQSPAGQHPVLGRTPKCKESSRAFKATVAMSEDFPLTVDMLLNVLEVCMI